MASATSPTGDCYNDNLSQFTHILDVPIDVAVDIVKNDKWFELNPDAKRSIKYDKNDSKIITVNVFRDSTSGCEVNKTITSVLLSPYKFSNITGGLLAAVLFSVKGNMGPFKEFEKFVNLPDITIPYDDDNKKMFLAHVAWYNANNGYGCDNDPLCIEETKIMNPIVVPATSSGNKIFDSELFKAFTTIIKKTDNPDIIRGLATDLNRANLYLSKLVPSGGNRKLRKKKYNRKSHKKSKQTKKHKKNGNRKSIKH